MNIKINEYINKCHVVWGSQSLEYGNEILKYNKANKLLLRSVLCTDLS